MRMPASRDVLAPADGGGKRDGRAPARGGGASVRGFIDRRFLAVVSWPSLLVMLIVTAVPFVFTIALAFTNYKLVFRDPDMRASVITTVWLTAGVVLLSLLLGLGVALLLDHKFRGRGAVRMCSSHQRRIALNSSLSSVCLSSPRFSRETSLVSR